MRQYIAIQGTNISYNNLFPIGMLVGSSWLNLGFFYDERIFVYTVPFSSHSAIL